MAFLTADLMQLTPPLLGVPKVSYAPNRQDWRQKMFAKAPTALFMTTFNRHSPYGALRQN